MKRFRFQLDSLLRLKKQFRRISELKQLEMKAKKETAYQRVEELKRQLQLASDRFSQHVGESIRAGTYLSDRFCSAQIRDGITEAQHIANQTEQAYRQADEKRRRFAVEVEALENLRIKQWNAYRKQVSRQNLETLDDMILRNQMESQRLSKEVDPHA